MISSTERQLGQRLIDQRPGLHLAERADVIGHHGMATLEENARIVSAIDRESSPDMTSAEQTHLEFRLAHLAGPHALCWACSDYVDGGVC